MSQQHAENKIDINSLGGLSRIDGLFNQPIRDFTNVQNAYHQRAHAIQAMGGITALQLLQGKRILSIHQTNDKRENIIIQTNQGVILMSEDELFNRTYAHSLTPITINEEETMPKGIIIHQLATNTHSGVATVTTTWTQAPLSAILSQLNADGTAAAFITALAANIFTLAAGTYRFNGWSFGAAAAGNSLRARLFNVTTGLAAWNGLANAAGPAIDANTSTTNVLLPFGGDLTIAVPTQFQIEVFTSAGLANGMGLRKNSGGHEVYRWLEIIKTA